MTAGVDLTGAQRAAAIDRAGENLALLSGAGCGKTLVLAMRFMHLLGQGGEGPEALRSLVALTFTEKAAMEMSQRVRKMLAQAAAGATGPQRTRYRAWLEELPEARISTIHSFCASLLRAYAVEAGVDPGFGVIDDQLLADAMVQEAADAAVLNAVEAGGDEGLVRLLGRMPYDRIVEQVSWLMERRTVAELEAYADTDATLQRWRDLLAAEGEREWALLTADEAFARDLDDLADRACSAAADRLAARRDETVAILRGMLSGAAHRTPANFEALAVKLGNIGSDAAWGGEGSAKAVRDRIKALVARVGPLAAYSEQLAPADRDAAEALAALTALARDADLRYGADKRARGKLDFTDLLAHAHRLLCEKPAVRRALADQARQLLIDECQDTDAFQVSLLMMLAAPDDSAGPLPQGRLFVVGDAKQSIYRFRGAQVEVFEDLCEHLGPDAREELDLSFRTHEAGIAFVNHLFAPLMGDGYAPIRAHRTHVPPGESVEILLAAACEAYPIDSAASSSRAQAALTAQRIREMLDGQERTVWDSHAQDWRAVRPGDVAILFSRMTQSGDYERELQLRQVPYHVLAGTGFFQQQEIFDVLNVLRVVDNPFDDVAFFGVLRGSLFGLDDNALVHVAEAQRPPYLPGLDADKLADVLGPRRGASLAAACALLRDLHRRKDALGIDAIIERLLDATGLEATLLSQFQGRRMLGNVRQLMERARSAGADGMALADFITQMNEMVINESRYEQAAIAGEAQDVVRLLTIHKAKGLEFPVVIIPDLNAGHRDTSGMLLHRGDWGLTCKLPADSSGQDSPQPLAWQVAVRHERDDRHREDLRRLYVAATRHQDHLVFLGADHRTNAGGFQSSGSYLSQMDEVLGLAEAVDAAAGVLPYADGRFQAAVRRVEPQPPGRGTGDRSAGRKLLAEASDGADLGERMVRLAGHSRPKSGAAPAPPLLGPLPPSVGDVELAVTALSEFEHCPMLYRWRYELRVPRGEAGRPAEGTASPITAQTGLDPATLGTLLHGCMERLDFRCPQRPGDLVARAVAEMDLQEDRGLDAIAAELAGMMQAFARHPLGARLREAAQTFRELDFVLARPPVTLRGQIDLLYQDAQGAWHVVDYKSDRLEAADAAEHAARYELQMLAYAVAAGRQAGAAVADATLYFLRPAVTHTFAFSPANLAGAEGRIARLGAELIAARRAGQFAPHRAEPCRTCPYAELCERL